MVANADQSGRNIGVGYTTLLEAADLIKRGLPFGAVARLHRHSGLTLDRIKCAARISEGSFARRKRSGRLSQDESERLLRIARIVDLAVALHDGDASGARQWLESPIPALANQRPLDVSQTEPGAREVEDLIGRIGHGIVS
jgi:putative toxin-antitoxin system antitoxin component (TIGR02293 family)